MAEAYIYTTPEADHLRIESRADGFANVHIRTMGDGWSAVEVPPGQRSHAAQALAGDRYHVVPAEQQVTVGIQIETLTREVHYLRKQLHEAEAQAPQPDPLDPLRRKLHDDDRPEPAPAAVEALLAMLRQAAAERRTVAETAEVLIRRGVTVPEAEPEPDEAAVELVLGVLQNVPRAPADISLVDQARELVRRNVRVMPDAE